MDHVGDRLEQVGEEPAEQEQEDEGEHDLGEVHGGALLPQQFPLAIRLPPVSASILLQSHRESVHHSQLVER